MSTQTADLAMDGFERTTARWGRLTMSATLIICIIAPMGLVLFGDFGITFNHLLTAYLAVAAVYLVIAVVEPVTYFPVLGQAGMYQAFMIGNIANKLLPAAIIAQNRMGVKPGSRQGDLVSVMAICGAAVVHVLSLLIFVGIFGTWLLSVIPENITEVAQEYILPSILGAILVQAAVTVKQPRSTLFALAAGALVIFVIMPLFPALGAFSTALAVLLTVLSSWYLRNKNQPVQGEHPADDDGHPQ